jgi:hypothetical protein
MTKSDVKFNNYCMGMGKGNYDKNNMQLKKGSHWIKKVEFEKKEIRKEP